MAPMLAEDLRLSCLPIYPRMAPTMNLPVLVPAAAATAGTTSPEPSRQRLRAIYEELVNSNTSYSTGQTTQAAQAMARRFLEAGFPPGDVVVVGAAPHKQNVVA